MYIYTSSSNEEKSRIQNNVKEHMKMNTKPTKENIQYINTYLQPTNAGKQEDPSKHELHARGGNGLIAYT